MSSAELHTQHENLPHSVTVQGVELPLEALQHVTDRNTALFVIRDFARDNLQPLPEQSATDGVSEAATHPAQLDHQAVTTALEKLNDQTSQVPVELQVDQAALASVAQLESEYPITELSVEQALAYITTFPGEIRQSPEKLLLMDDDALVAEIRQVITAKIDQITTSQRRQVQRRVAAYAVQLSQVSAGAITLRPAPTTSGEGQSSIANLGNCTLETNQAALDAFAAACQQQLAEPAQMELSLPEKDETAEPIPQTPVEVPETPSKAAVEEPPAPVLWPDRRSGEAANKLIEATVPTTVEAEPTTDASRAEEATATIDTTDTPVAETAPKNERKILELQQKYFTVTSVYELLTTLQELVKEQGSLPVAVAGEVQELPASTLLAQMDQLTQQMHAGEWYQVFQAIDPDLNSNRTIHPLLADRIMDVINAKYVPERQVCIQMMQQVKTATDAIKVLQQLIDMNRPYFELPSGLAPDKAPDRLRFKVDAVIQMIKNKNFSGGDGEAALAYFPRLKPQEAQKNAASSPELPPTPEQQKPLEKREVIEKLDLDFGFKSEKGPDKNSNEDAAGMQIEVQTTQGPVQIDIICDGVSSVEGGPLARFIIDQYKYQLSSVDENNDIDTIFQIATSAVQRDLVNSEFYTKNISTTFVAALRSKDSLITYHTGDSRVYVYQDGTLQRITKDISKAEELIDGGLSESELRNHPERNKIVGYIAGNRQIKLVRTPPLGEAINLNEDAVVMVTSDGVHGRFDGFTGEGDPLVQEILSENITAQDKADTLSELAKKRKTKDDATVIVTQKKGVTRTQKVAKVSNVSRNDYTGTQAGRSSETLSRSSWESPTAVNIDMTTGIPYTKHSNYDVTIAGTRFTPAEYKSAVIEPDTSNPYATLYVMKLTKKLPLLRGGWRGKTQEYRLRMTNNTKLGLDEAFRKPK